MNKNKDAEPEKICGADLFEAVQNKDSAKVLSLLERKGIDLDWSHPESGKTALHLATEAQDCIFIALLLGKGGKIHLRDKEGKTPLNLALQTPNQQCLELLANKAISSLEEASRQKANENQRFNTNGNKPPIYESLVAKLTDRDEGELKELKERLEKLVASPSSGSSVVDEKTKAKNKALLAIQSERFSTFLNGDTREGRRKNEGEEGEGDHAARERERDRRESFTSTPPPSPSLSSAAPHSSPSPSSLAPSRHPEAVKGPTGKQSFFERHLPRQSYMSEMLQISHFQTIYNIFVAVLILNFFNTIITNYVESGKVIDLSLLFWCFGDFHLALGLWGIFFCYSFVVVGFQKAIIEKWFPSPSFYYFLYAISIVVLYFVPPVIVLEHRFPVATGFFIMAEVVRMSMKMHSFMMTNKALLAAKENGVKEPMVDLFPANVNVGNYFYFMWAPTLVYQPEFPRTEKIRPLWVVGHFLETLFAILYTYTIFVRHCLPLLSSMTGEADMLMFGVFKLMLPGTVVLLLGFYGILHCWLNAFAELTCFADRQFYRDWWNSTDWATYYRKWNVVVHKFLYYHIFLESLHFGFSKNMAMLITFMVSAVIHEYIIASAIGFYKPILLVMFAGPGVFFIYLTRNWRNSRISNIFMWMMLFIGNGMLCAFYFRCWYFFYKDKSPDDPFSWQEFWGVEKMYDYNLWLK